MKKIVLSLLALCTWTAAFAQLSASGEGFYRIQNIGTLDYMTLRSAELPNLDKNNFKVNWQAFYMVAGGDNEDLVVSNPASVFYIKCADKEKNFYDLQAQGEDTWKLSGQRFHVTIESQPAGGYVFKADGTAYGYSGLVATLSEDYSTKTVTTGGGSFKDWYIKPITNTTSNFFGVTPSFTANEKYYTTMYASFAYSFASTGMKAYVVDSIDGKHRVAIIKELTGTVPAGTPVILQCTSLLPSGNKLNLLKEGGTRPANNALTGVYFNSTQNASFQTAYDANTMRVLGLASDGSLAFVKAPTVQRTILANTAYLKVPAGSPDEFKVMTREEYDKDPEVTVVIESATREYGDVNPVFKYTVTGGTLKGIVSFVCAATTSSTVGDYPITLNTAALANAKINVTPGKLTITKAPLVVTASDGVRLRGEGNPTMRISYSGFKNSDGPSSLSAQPTISCDANRDSAPGIYDIIVSGGISQNYSFTYNKGQLTVLEYRIKANDATREYGAINPQFSYTPAGVLSGTPVFTTTAERTSNVGTYPISISQGTVTNKYIEYQDGTLTITPATINVEFTQSEYTISQGDPLPNFILRYRGLRNNEAYADVLDEIPTVNHGVTDTRKAGDYIVNIIGGHARYGNYNLTRSSTVLHIVSEANVTITANNVTRYYGDPNPEFTYTAEGNTLKGAPALACNATATSPVGEYEIGVSEGSIANYNYTLNPGKLTILPAPLTATVGDYTRKEGEANPNFQVTYSGFKNGETAETEGVITKKPKFTCAANLRSEPGEYAITASDAVAPNYEITYKPGTLTVIEKNQLVITADSYTIRYGQRIPASFYYSTEGAVMKGVPELVCETPTNPGVGEYPIVVKQGTVTNKNIKFVDGVLTIVKANLSASAGEYTREVGEENPEFKITYSGFAYNENERVLTLQPRATTKATKDSPAGEYEVTVSNDGFAANYNIIPINGKLIITAPSGIDSLTANGTTFDVYTTTGLLVRRDATSLRGLAKGVYIVNGKKVVVK